MEKVKVREKKIHIKEYYAEDGKQEYRYLLTRYWDEGNKIATVIMCNPSDASYLYEDKTAMNVNNFFVKEGYNKINIVNLFSYRDKNVAGIKNKNDKYESSNDIYIKKAVLEADIVVVAWGFGKENSSKNELKSRIQNIKLLLKTLGIKAKCFKNKTGEVNCHPMYLNLDTWTLVDYNLD